MKEVEELRIALADLVKKEQNQFEQLQKQLGSVGSRASLLVDHSELVNLLCDQLEQFKTDSNAAPALETLEQLRAHINEPFRAYVHELEKEAEQESAQIERAITLEAHDLSKLTAIGPAAQEKLAQVVKETKEHIRAYELELDAVKHIKDSLRLFMSVQDELGKLAKEMLELITSTNAALARAPDAFIDKIVQLWKTIDNELTGAIRKELTAVEHLQGLFTQKYSILRLPERYNSRRGILNWLLGKNRITVQDIERDIKLMIRPQQFSTYSTTLLLDFKEMLTFEAIEFLRTKTHIVEQEITNREVKFTSSIAMDTKTGLRSNRVISEEFKVLTTKAQRRNQKVGFIMVDIDNFKNLNGYYGVTIADNVLNFVATTMKDSVRSTDEVYRWGGEEIIVLLPSGKKEITKEITMERAELIRATVQEKSRAYMKAINEGIYMPEEARYQPVEEVTVSIGVGMYPDTAKTEIELTRLVWDAVKKAKGSGRNKVVAA
ncbi:GGDEF domain-containing protein [Candidatus Woesearchaeota archaeon]|nr:GGDEF domain-containing protein [Candidatus Woesearchaeota archaeon]